jgi:hypothetical protein
MAFSFTLHAFHLYLLASFTLYSFSFPPVGQFSTLTIPISNTFLSPLKLKDFNGPSTDTLLIYALRYLTV